MATLDRKGKIPVYDEEGNLVYYEIDLPPSSPFRKLRDGTNPLTYEAELRRHKRELNYKEPPSTLMECKRCKKRIIRTHATQKYCMECGKVVKREGAKARKQRQRERDKKVDHERQA